MEQQTNLTMASIMTQKRRCQVVFGLVCAFSLCVPGNSASLQKGVQEVVIDPSGSLEGLWEHAAAAANLQVESLLALQEYERGLQGMEMSMERPTSSPVATTPTQSSSGVPTMAPEPTNGSMEPGPTLAPAPTTQSPVTGRPTPTAAPIPATSNPGTSIPATSSPATRNPTMTPEPTGNGSMEPGPTLAPAPTTQSPVTGRPTPTAAPIPATSTPAMPTSAPVLSPVPRPTEAPLSPTPRPTLGPTVNCGEDREGFIRSVLTPITDASILLDPTTPQGMAYNFLVNEDDYLADPCGKMVEQRYGLVTLYYSTSGADWTNNQGWLEPINECEWAGVTCDDALQVTELKLAINGLDGEIPNEILTLVGLREFDIFANSIRGTIPEGFAQLVNLQALDMQENLLTGPAFPASILELRRLESYRINSNSLTGPVPSRIGSLRSLEELWAAKNDITGSLPTEMGNLRDLKTVLLYENSLEGPLPSELGLIPLEGLWMWGNFFQDTIPSQLFNVASLKTFRLENNFFFGSLPTQIGQITDLQDLRIDNNNLSGQIPSQIGFLTDLETLRLNDNFWTGTIPDVFQNYGRLDFFDISENLVAGPIPKTIFDIPSIRLIYMHNCSLTGTIPPQYSTPPLLRDLYLTGNPITGTVPPIASGELEQLNEFLLQRTLLTGTMPDSVCNLRANFILDDLWTDCGGQSPEIICEFPECCNRCFEGRGASMR